MSKVSGIALTVAWVVTFGVALGGVGVAIVQLGVPVA